MKLTITLRDGKGQLYDKVILGVRQVEHSPGGTVGIYVDDGFLVYTHGPEYSEYHIEEDAPINADSTS